jgi:hypothetical protein
LYPYRFGKENIFSAESTGHSDREMILKRLQRFWEENEGEGYLSFQISTAQGALPVKAARVTVTKDLGDGYGLSMNFEQYVLVGSTVRSYLSWLKDTGKLKAEFQDSMLLWQKS